MEALGDKARLLAQCIFPFATLLTITRWTQRIFCLFLKQTTEPWYKIIYNDISVGFWLISWQKYWFIAWCKDQQKACENSGASCIILQIIVKLETITWHTTFLIFYKVFNRKKEIFLRVLLQVITYWSNKLRKRNQSYRWKFTLTVVESLTKIATDVPGNNYWSLSILGIIVQSQSHYYRVVIIMMLVHITLVFIDCNRRGRSRMGFFMKKTGAWKFLTEDISKVRTNSFTGLIFRSSLRDR